MISSSSTRTLLILLLAACTEQPPPAQVEVDTDADTDTDTDTDTDGDSDTDTETDLPHETADTGPTEPPPIVDCSTTPQGPFVYTTLSAPRAYHGLAFDQLGGLVGSDNTSVIRATDPDTATLWLANVGGAQQMDYLPNGDLVVASTGQASAIVKVDPAGVSTVLATGINAYGVEVGPDGMVYTANQNQVHQIDPVAGGAVTYIPTSVISVPKVINFNRDGSRMYIGTNSSNGQVWEVEIDAVSDPIFPPRLLANTGGSWHDGLGVDACGNIYVNEFWTGAIYLIDPIAGGSTLLFPFESQGPNAYGHGMQWGSGVGAWSDHNIFVPLPYNGDRVAEIQLGIPSRDFNGGYYETTP